MNLEEVTGRGNDAHGVWSDLEPEDHRFPEVGVNVHVLEPGQAASQYHAESEQEAFLVLSGEPLLIVEEQERRLRPGDVFHSPGGTRHVFVGAGDGRSAILMIGARRLADAILYPVSPVAARDGASVEASTPLPSEAYRGWPDDEPRRFPWLV